MPTAALDGLLWTARRVAGPDTEVDSDAVLLCRIASAANEAAFADVLRRHGPWVLGLCRRLIPDAHAAEDAFQATFLVLLQRAAEVRRQASAASWLHGVALRVAARARRRLTRFREPLPMTATRLAPDPSTVAIKCEEAHILHEEIARLPASHREPLLLCDLAGLSRDEAARRLGCGAEALKGRLERGRMALRQRLIRRGVVAAVSAYTAAVPAALEAAVCRAAAGLITGLSVVPNAIAELMSVGLRSPSVPKLIGVAVLLAGVAAGVGWGSTGTGQPVAPPPIAALPRAADDRHTPAALREAIELLDTLQGDPMERSRLWCYVAKLQHKLGNPEAPRAALVKARAEADTLGDQRYLEWRIISEGLAALGDDRAIMALAADAPDTNERDSSEREQILIHATSAAIDAGHFAAATRIGAGVPKEESQDIFQSAQRRTALIRRAQAGDVAGAVRGAAALPRPSEHVAALVGRTPLSYGFDDGSRNFGIARIQLDAGDEVGARASARQALAVLATMPEGHRRYVAVETVAMLARSGDIAAAHAALALVPKAHPANGVSWPSLDHWLVHAKCHVAAAEVRAGRLAAAVALTDGPYSEAERAELFQHIALAQARAGDKAGARARFDKAVELAERARRESSNLLHRIAATRAAAGDFAGAGQMVQRFGLESAWPHIAYFQAKAGDCTGARETAAKNKLSRWWQGMVSSFVAQEQARQDHELAARQWIDAERDPLMKAYALVGLAEGLHREEDKRRTP